MDTAGVATGRNVGGAEHLLAAGIDREGLGFAGYAKKGRSCDCLPNRQPSGLDLI